MQTDTPNENSCGTGSGSLPGSCAPLAFPYIPIQEQNPPRYDRKEALQTGTLFPGLNLPFKAAPTSQSKMENTALVELMAMDFVIDDLGLYLTTHPDDKEVLNLYWASIKLAQEGRQKYEKMYGPLFQTTPTEDGSFTWLKNPWPWDEGGNA